MRKKARVSAVGIALFVLAAVAVPAQAAGPTIIALQVCSGAGGLTVPRNTELDFRAGWGSKTKAQEANFKKNVKVVVTIDGVKLTNTRSYWQPPYRPGGGGGDWAMQWLYKVAGLSRGHSMTMTYQWVLLTSITDGYQTFPAGKFFHPKLNCTVTAS